MTSSSTGNLVGLAAGAGIGVFAWKLGGFTADKSALIGGLTFIVLSIVAELVLSKAKRQDFKSSYQRIHRNVQAVDPWPKSSTLVVLSAIGVVGSLLLGMPLLLTLAFLVMLALFALHLALMRR